jgi:hypothetical protein
MELHEAAMHAAQAAQSAAVDSRELLRELLEQTRLRNKPAEWERIVLTQTNPVYEWVGAVDAPTQSFGLYNPAPIPVYLGLGGGTPTIVAGAPSVPPRSLVVLPVSITSIEVGVDPSDQASLAAGDAVLFGMRFATVQQPYMEAL